MVRTCWSIFEKLKVFGQSSFGPIFKILKFWSKQFWSIFKKNKWTKQYMSIFEKSEHMVIWLVVKCTDFQILNFSINVSIRWIGFRNSFSSVLTKTEILVYKLWSIFSNYKKFRSNEFWSIFENSKILVNQFRLIIGKMDQKRYTKVLVKKKPMGWGRVDPLNCEKSAGFWLFIF